MRGKVFIGLFDRLEALVPDIAQPVEGASYFANPRVKGDLATYCSISNVDGSRFELSIAQDAVVGDRTEPAPWMVFAVDLSSRTAELMAIEDRWRYEVLYSADSAANPRRTQLHAFALNNLSAMLNLGGAFRPIENPVHLVA